MVGDVATDLVKVAEKCKSQTVSMTKADLIAVIADKLKFFWARAELLVDVVFYCMEQSMIRGEKIEIRGFGTFQVRSYRAYRGRNPRTGQIVDVTPKRLPHFKVSTELAVRVNDGRRSTKAAAAPEPIKPRAPVATVAAREPSEF
jgi:integration host factor subunit beta